MTCSPGFRHAEPRAPAARTGRRGPGATLLALALLVGAQRALAQDTPDDPARTDAAAAPAEAAHGDPPSTADAPVASPRSASQLFASFARVECLAARFVEEKRLALLAAPLVTKGRLYFLRPGRLARVVESPRPATLVITPEQVRMEGPDGVETIDLRSSDVVRGFVTSLVQVFSGDEKELARSYEVAFSLDDAPATPDADAGDRTGEASPPGWTLVLTPKGEPLTKLLARLELRGSGALVHTIVVHEANGDRSTTRLLEVDPAHRFDDAERLALFGPAPAR